MIAAAAAASKCKQTQSLVGPSFLKFILFSLAKCVYARVQQIGDKLCVVLGKENSYYPANEANERPPIEVKSKF